jgi:hypothetical protein
MPSYFSAPAEARGTPDDSSAVHNLCRRII